jgi:hypothetical protein
MKVQIDENFSIEKNGRGVDLIENTGRLNKKNEPITVDRHYGTLYQALIGYLNHGPVRNSEGGLKLPDAVTEVCKCTRAIKAAEQEIKENFSVEVRVG